ncbi:hypothetical protein [Candidatus Uabimicrobium sp. HlEnr_7]|uniref:hypothetical protein n=1 Tax=Candidatus Uabimicrobium helgolandensis TaxID=3095367 RepID=UPI0035582E57
MITQEELFRKVGARYTMFVQLQINESDLAVIESCNTVVSDELIFDLLVDGSSWREHLLALFFICKRNISVFYEPLFDGLRNPRGISIVPICSVITLCIKEADCAYDEALISDLDRNVFDGAIRFGLDKMKYHIGLSKEEIKGCDPNHGHNFEEFYEFYRDLYVRNNNDNRC